jgi:hypothetical protein
MALTVLLEATALGGLAVVVQTANVWDAEAVPMAMKVGESAEQEHVAGESDEIWGDADEFHVVFRSVMGDASDFEWPDDPFEDGVADERVRISGSAAKAFDRAGKERGFVIETVKAGFIDGWDRDEMNKLLDFGCTGPLCLAPDMPEPGLEEGRRISQYVNLFDSGDRGAFSAANGHPDATFPGIDPIERPAADPAAGDDDSAFATEVRAIIHLTDGLHVIGVNDADGTIIEIGGIEIGRSPEWKEASNSDFVFEVETPGYYTLRARHLAGAADAGFELHEFVKTEDGAWKRILLGDVANGGSVVYVPEPATVAVMGLGVWVLLRRKR